MDKTVTVRFYKVERLNEADPKLRDVLKGIAAIAELDARIATVGNNDVKVRLERLEEDSATVIAGEFTRIQTTNYPSEVHPDGTKPLGVTSPLGHGVAFRFDSSKSILAMQYDVRVLSPGRMLEYLRAKWDGASFRLRPIVRSDMWKRFNAGPTRKIELTVASPGSLVNIEDAGAAVVDAARKLGAAYEAPLLTITLSMGGKSGALGAQVKKMAKSLFETAAAGMLDLRGMKAVADGGEGPNDEINLMEELLTERKELNLPDNDPDESYKTRSKFIKEMLKQNLKNV